MLVYIILKIMMTPVAVIHCTDCTIDVSNTHSIFPSYLSITNKHVSVCAKKFLCSFVVSLKQEQTFDAVLCSELVGFKF